MALSGIYVAIIVGDHTLATSKEKFSSNTLELVKH